MADRHEALCGAPFCRETWNMVGSDLGLLAAALPEALGGMEAGAAAHGILMKTFGRHLVSQPYLSSMVMASALLDPSDAFGAEWLSSMARGEAIIVAALADGPDDLDLQSADTHIVIDPDGWAVTGRKTLVRDAPLADHFVVLARHEVGENESVALLMVPANAPGVAPTCLIASGDEARVRAERAIDNGIVAVCAEAVGIMQAMLEQTVGYARQRTQFGQPIASFQVLQHRMVDMSVTIEQAESITRLARGKLGSDDRSAAASAAMALVSKACRSVSQAAIQIHGAVGIADETPVSRYFRRATAIESQFGGREYHLSRYIASSRLR